MGDSKIRHTVQLLTVAGDADQGLDIEENASKKVSTICVVKPPLFSRALATYTLRSRSGHRRG
jgi:hypothetical protein